MAQITWRNIGNSGGAAAANKGTANGVETIMNAFDPLEEQLKNRVALDAQNWDAQAAQNTRNMRSQLQQIGSLGELNRMQDEGLITEAAFNKQFGAQYDSSAVNSAIDARRQALQRTVLDNLNSDALAAADQERDLSAGAAKLRELIKQNGGRGDFAERAATAFMNNNKDRLSQYTQANQEDLDKFLGSEASPENPKQVNDLVERGRQAGIKNLDALRERATGELNAHYMHDKYRWEAARNAREADTYDRENSERRALDNAYTTANRLMREQGLNSKEAYSRVSSMVPGRYQQEVLSNITNQEINMSSMTPQQKELMGRTIAKGQQQITDYQASIDAEEAAIIKQRNTVTGITPTVLKVVDDSYKNGGIVNKIVSGVSEGWDWNTKVDTDKDDVEAALNDFRNQTIRDLPDATPQEVDALIWLAYQDSNKRAGSKIGLDTTSMQKALEKKMADFKKGEAIEQDRINFKAAATKDISLFNETLVDFTTASKQSVETLNKTGKAGDVVGSLKKIADGTLTIPKDKNGHFTTGVLAQRRKQKKDAADAKAAKEAADKLNEIRERGKRTTEEYEQDTAKKPEDSSFLKTRIAQEMGVDSYQQPSPDVIPFVLKKRPQ